MHRERGRTDGHRFQHIGSQGGTLEVDGVTLTFPPGALAANETITIEANMEAPPRMARGAVTRGSKIQGDRARVAASISGTA